ncbi:MAG: hypothetical protein WCA22_12430 [Candidatus Binatus sp.]
MDRLHDRAEELRRLKRDRKLELRKLEREKNKATKPSGHRYCLNSGLSITDVGRSRGNLVVRRSLASVCLLPFTSRQRAGEMAPLPRWPVPYLNRRSEISRPRARDNDVAMLRAQFDLPNMTAGPVCVANY